MLKFTLKYLIFPPTYFGPFGPSSGRLHWGWSKWTETCRSEYKIYFVFWTVHFQ